MSDDQVIKKWMQMALENQQFFQKIAAGSLAVAQLPRIEYEYNPRELVYQHDKIKLYHYQSAKKISKKTPLLVVFATVNRPEILDLFPEQSFIGHLLQEGQDVYLLDWGYPAQEDQVITLGQYINRYLQGCIQFIKQKHQLEKINLLGICQGGLICLCYSILQADIKNLVLISTPIDFNTAENKVAKFLKQIDVKLLVDVMGNVSGDFLTQFFISLRPFELVGKKYLRFIDKLGDDAQREKFLRVEKWLYDAPDQTGASFKELIETFYQGNKLITDEAYLDGKRIQLNQLNIPVLNIMADEDEIVPVSASCDLKRYIASKDYTAKEFHSGHIGIYISDKVVGPMASAIAEWLNQR